MALPDVRERLVALGSEPSDFGPDKFGAFIKAEAAKWGEVVKSSGARAE
jgi:tripartite-type tricarboxylate transporter receptor subunit TctC